MPRRMTWAAPAVAAALLVTLSACSSDTTTSAVGGVDDRDCITDFQPGTDYFPDKVEIDDAENFSISYHDSYQVLTVDEPFPGGAPESYVLVKCGAPDPELDGELAQAQQITVPVTSAFSASTTHLPFFSELDRIDTVTGVADGGMVTDTRVRERVADGAVTEFAPGGVIDTEQVVIADPDVLITGGTEDADQTRLRRAGIPVVANAEWLEETPLGRAEWIKMIGALTGTEARATTVYDGIKSDYAAVAERAAGLADTPVLPGTMYEGTWFMPAGGSYVGTLISDAGGIYPWADDPATGSLQLNFETVYARAGDVPLWLVVDQWETVADVLAAEPQYGELAAVRDGQVWNANKATGPGGGNDYWERGVARPDLILADLLAILHPEVVDDHEFVFYQQLTR